jgi:alpha-D-xyloside xylohydrolase
MKRSIHLALVLSCLATGAAAQASRPDPELPVRWREAAPGVWRADVGRPEEAGLLRAAGGTPRREALAGMPDADFPLPARPGVRAFSQAGRVYLRIPLGPDEELYGLGLNFQSVRQRGSVKRLHVDHYAGSDNGRTHAPVPFYVSSAGYGVLVDAARYVTVYAGTAVRVDAEHPPEVRDRNTDPRWTAQPRADAVEILVPTTGASVYVFAGPTPLDAVRRYNLYSGGGVLPPKWGLGFMQRVPTLFTADRVEAEVEAFARRGYPLDMIGLEPGWQSAAYPGTFVWDRSRFPDPAGLLGRLRGAGIHVNLWMNPYVAPQSPIYDSLRGLSGSHTVWTGIVPDYSLARAREVFAGLLRREVVGPGVSGFKIDEVDGYDRWLWPDHATFPSGLVGEQMRQLYGLYLQRLAADLYRESGRRTYGLARGSNAGAAPLPFVLYDDYYSHPDFVTALVNSGFIGVLWTPEVRSSKSGEEWLRRMQSVCFSPLALLNAWSDGTEPWSFPEVADAVREVMLLRIRLLPYLYSTFAEYHYAGTPPIRPMALVQGFRIAGGAGAGGADSAYAAATRGDLRDQFMLGDELLVAPMFAGDTAREVVLPAGRWYDFHTGAYAGEREVITVRPGPERIPVFVRDGGVVPLLEPRRQVPGPGERVPLEVRHYGEAPGSFRLYDDDGESYDHERGEYSWTTLAVGRDADGTLRGRADLPPRGAPFSYSTVRWAMMPTR